MNTLTVAPDSLNIPTIWLGPVAVLTRSPLNSTAFDALAALVRKDVS